MSLRREDLINVLKSSVTMSESGKFPMVFSKDLVIVHTVDPARLSLVHTELRPEFFLQFNPGSTNEIVVNGGWLSNAIKKFEKECEIVLEEKENKLVVTSGLWEVMVPISGEPMLPIQLPKAMDFSSELTISTELLKSKFDDITSISKDSTHIIFSLKDGKLTLFASEDIDFYTSSVSFNENEIVQKGSGESIIYIPLLKSVLNSFFCEKVVISFGASRGDHKPFKIEAIPENTSYSMVAYIAPRVV